MGLRGLIQHPVRMTWTSDVDIDSRKVTEEMTRGQEGNRVERGSGRRPRREEMQLMKLHSSFLGSIRSEIQSLHSGGIGHSELQRLHSVQLTDAKRSTRTPVAFLPYPANYC